MMKPSSSSSGCGRPNQAVKMASPITTASVAPMTSGQPKPASAATPWSSAASGGAGGAVTVDLRYREIR